MYTVLLEPGGEIIVGGAVRLTVTHIDAKTVSVAVGRASGAPIEGPVRVTVNGEPMMLPGSAAAVVAL